MSDVFRRGFYITVIASLVGLYAVSIGAEALFVESAVGGQGQGWLFGSSIDASCWIATPKHVVEVENEVKTFLWRDQFGNEGRGVEPFHESADFDLVFARASGRGSGACLSRLGSADLTRTIMSQPVVWAQTMLKTNLRAVPMQVSDAGDQLLRFEPVEESDQPLMQQGISGAPLLYRPDPKSVGVPLAMITKIPREQQLYGLALRFDVVKAEFLSLAFDGPAGTGRADESSYQIVRANGVSATSETSADALKSKDGCWEAMPPEGQASFFVEIIPSGPEIHGVDISLDAACGPAPDSILVQAPQGQGWTTVASCTMQAATAVCVTGRRRVRALRIVIIKRDGSKAAINSLVLR